MPLIQAVGFNIGLEITAADPDLQVLGQNSVSYRFLSAASNRRRRGIAAIGVL